MIKILFCCRGYIKKVRRGGKRVSHLKNYKNAVIPRSKLTNYLLNPTKKPERAKLFASMGYNMSNHKRLESDIKAELKRNKAIKFSKDKHGHTFYEVDMKLGITEKKEIRTGWVIKKGNKNPSLTTAYKKR